MSSYTQYLYNLPHDRDNELDAVQTEDARNDTDGDVLMREASARRNYTLYTVQDKVKFFKLLFEKCLSASSAAKQLGIHVRTAQRWVQQYERDPDSIFEKRMRSTRKSL